MQIKDIDKTNPRQLPTGQKRFMYEWTVFLKFIFSKKVTKNTKSSPLIWHLLSHRQIDGEDFEIFRGLLRKHELYLHKGKPQ